MSEVKPGVVFFWVDKDLPLSMRLGDDSQGSCFLVECGQVPTVRRWQDRNTPCWPLPEGTLLVESSGLGAYARNLDAGMALFDPKVGVIWGVDQGGSGLRAPFVNLQDYSWARYEHASRIVVDFRLVWSPHRSDASMTQVWPPIKALPAA